MGHHIDGQGHFQSDKYPELPPDKIVLSFKDPCARKALWSYVAAVHVLGGDKDLADDIARRLGEMEKEA